MPGMTPLRKHRRARQTVAPSNRSARSIPCGSSEKRGFPLLDHDGSRGRHLDLSQRREVTDQPMDPRVQRVATETPQVRPCDVVFARSSRSATLAAVTEAVWVARSAASIFDFTRRAARAASLVWVRPVLTWSPNSYRHSQMSGSAVATTVYWTPRWITEPPFNTSTASQRLTNLQSIRATTGLEQLPDVRR